MFSNKNVKGRSRIPKKTKRILGIVLLVMVILFLGRGVWRNNILPSFASMRHRTKLETTIDKEIPDLNNHLQPLQLPLYRSDSPSCVLSTASLWHTSVYCSGQAQVARGVTQPLSSNDQSVKQVIQNFKDNGWQGGNQAGGELWLQFYKYINDFSCTVQVNQIIKDNTLNGIFFCNKSHVYFGNPR